MLQTLTGMLSFFQESKQNGSYFLLFLLSIFVIYRVSDSYKRWFIRYPVALLVLFIANPISIWLISLVFPSVTDYDRVSMALPMLLYIPFAVTELLAAIKDRRNRWLVAVCLLIVIGLSGNVYGYYRTDTFDNTYFYSKEKKEVINYLAGEDVRLVLADEEIIPFVSSYLTDTPLLYGMDLYIMGLDTGIMDEYDEELTDIYFKMKEPDRYAADISAMGLRYGCDIIILNRFAGATPYLGEYTCAMETKRYLVYRKR